MLSVFINSQIKRSEDAVSLRHTDSILLLTFFMNGYYISLVFQIVLNNLFGHVLFPKYFFTVKIEEKNHLNDHYILVGR